MLNWEIENEEMEKGYSIICGVDEAGRGPLAGPVMAAACILPADFDLSELRDSKLLSEKKREHLYNKIMETAVCAVDSASVEEIDNLNVLNASMLAMRRAVDKLTMKPHVLLIDGNIVRGFDDIPTKTIIRGDTLSPSIAAASILAKVTRDRLCRELNKLYPLYEIWRHKGYPTQIHRDLIKKYGVSPIHRKSFLGFLQR